MNLDKIKTSLADIVHNNQLDISSHQDAIVNATAAKINVNLMDKERCCPNIIISNVSRV